MKKLISLFLVVSILLLSGNLFAKERKGADLIIQRTDGQQVRGELIAVKQNSLLLLERESGADVTVDVGDIRDIKIVKKLKIMKGAGWGTLGGAAAGALFYLGLTLTEEYYWDEDSAAFMAISAILGAGIGLIIGGIIGVAAGIDKTIQIEGKSDAEIQEILEKLRKKARVRNSQWLIAKKNGQIIYLKEKPFLLLGGTVRKTV